MKTFLTFRFISLPILFGICFQLVASQLAWGQPDSQSSGKDLEKQEQILKLVKRQKVLVARIEQLENRLSQLSNLETGRNQNRSDLLKKSHQLSQALELVSELKKTVTLLESGTALDLKKAIAGQQKAVTDLGKIYQLLASDDPLKTGEAEQKKIRKRIDRIQQLIQQQESVRQRIDGKDFDALKKDQARIQSNTKSLRTEIENDDKQQNDQPDTEKNPLRNDGKGTKQVEQEPRGQNGRPDPQSMTKEEKIVDRLQQAESQMQDAHARLNPEIKLEAGSRMDAALKELGKAKQELEEILRQNRETEIKSTLRTLEERFKTMLQIQLKINQATVALEDSKESASEKNIEAFELANQQRNGINEADRALLVLNEEGSSRAIPGTVKHIKLDMLDVVDRLQLGKVDQQTIELQAEIETMLVELIKAVQEEQADQENIKKQGGRPAEATELQERPLVQKISELKIVKQLQQRINSRHRSYTEKTSKDKSNSEISRKIRQLSERQKQLELMIRDLIIGAE